MIRTQIYIPNELRQAAKMLAKNKNEPLAKLLRRLINAGIGAEKAASQPKSLLPLSKLGLKGGPKDLSQKMDKYLYDKKS